MILNELKRLYADQDTTNFGVLDFVAVFGSPLEAAAYSKLFWPDFIELDGMIFRDSVVEDESDRQRVREALERYGGDRNKTEASFNLLEMPSGVFGKRITETSDSINRYLAAAIGEMWRARLKAVFADREFVVDVELDSTDEPTVTFHQLRTSSS